MEKIFAIAFIALLFFGCTQQLQKPPQQESPSNTVPKTIVVSFKVISGSETLFDKALPFAPHVNAFDALKQAMQVQAQEYPFGVFVTSIEGVAADSEHYWALYVDGQYAEKGIDQYSLEKNTEIKFVLEEITDYTQN